jgi:hypothetical protein
VRPQHGDVVADVLGVGRADADVDHRDAAVVPRRRWYAGICGRRGGALPIGPTGGARPPRIVTTLPGSTNAS